MAQVFNICTFYNRLPIDQEINKLELSDLSHEQTTFFMTVRELHPDDEECGGFALPLGFLDWELIFWRDGAGDVPWVVYVWMGSKEPDSVEYDGVIYKKISNFPAEWESEEGKEPRPRYVSPLYECWELAIKLAKIWSEDVVEAQFPNWNPRLSIEPDGRVLFKTPEMTEGIPVNNKDFLFDIAQACKGARSRARKLTPPADTI